MSEHPKRGQLGGRGKVLEFALKRRGCGGAGARAGRADQVRGGTREGEQDGSHEDAEDRLRARSSNDRGVQGTE